MQDHVAVPQEFIEGATNRFALWWMSTYETIIKGGKCLNLLITTTVLC